MFLNNSINEKWLCKAQSFILDKWQGSKCEFALVKVSLEIKYWKFYHLQFIQNNSSNVLHIPKVVTAWFIYGFLIYFMFLYFSFIVIALVDFGLVCRLWRAQQNILWSICLNWLQNIESCFSKSAYTEKWNKIDRPFSFLVQMK